MPAPDATGPTVGRSQEEHPAPAGPVDDPSDPFATWTSDRRYEIERIVKAVQLPNRTWQIHVKWKGFGDDHITPESLSRIRREVKDPALLDQIQRAQDDFLAANPAQRNFIHPDPPAPMRVQPHRSSRVGHATVLHLALGYTTDTETAAAEDTNHVCRGLHAIALSLRQRSAAREAYRPDFPDCALIYAASAA